MAEEQPKSMRVVVNPGRQLYLPGGIHPFREGDALDLDEAQAQPPLAEGVLRLETPPPAPPPPDAPHAEPEPHP